MERAVLALEPLEEGRCTVIWVRTQVYKTSQLMWYSAFVNTGTVIN